MVVEKINGKLNAKVIDKFKKELSKHIAVKKQDAINFENSIEDDKQNLVSLIRTLGLIKNELENLKTYSSNISSHIKQEIEEVKTLPFVQGIEVNSTGIEIDVGRINILFRSKEVYIGDFIIYIMPSGVKIKCTNPILEWENDVLGIQHPHISDAGRICYGDERGMKIEEYFAKFELKKLVYFVYLFLKSYNQSDKYFAISYWTDEKIRRLNK